MTDSIVLYNSIGVNYNATRQADPYLTNRLYNLLLAAQNGSYLDIGCGTGNYTIALADKGLLFTGIEPSEAMLFEARKKSTSINWINGTAESIPLPDSFFDGAIATLTLHHWQSIEQGFAELFRVLKPDGKFVVFTSLPEQMQGYWLNHYFPQMLNTSIEQMPSIEQIEQASLQTGFTLTVKEKYFIRPELKDLFLYSGKHKPEMYFIDPVRQGISSFASLANKKEVEKGLEMLSHDIAKNDFEKVKKKFDNDLGDYLFLKLEKMHKVN